MATPKKKTKDEIFQDLNSFILENGELYREVHRDMYEAGEELTVDNFNQRAQKVQLRDYDKNREYVTKAQGLIPPERKIKITPEEDEKVQQELLKPVADLQVVLQKEQRQPSIGEDEALVESIYDKSIVLADLYAEKQRKQAQEEGTPEEELQGLYDDYFEEYKSYLLIKASALNVDTAKVKETVLAKRGKEEYGSAEYFQDTVDNSEVTVEQIAAFINDFNDFEKKQGRKGLSAKNPVIRRIPSGMVEQALDYKDPLVMHLYVQEWIDKAAEEQVRAERKDYDTLPDSDQKSLLEGKKKYIRTTLKDKEEDATTAYEKILLGQERGFFDIKTYQEQATSIESIKAALLNIEDPEAQKYAARHFDTTKEIEKQDRVIHNKNISDFNLLLEQMAFWYEDSGGYSSLAFESVKESTGPYDVRAMEAASSLGITDYDSFLKASQRLFDERLDLAKHALVQNVSLENPQYWTKGFSGPATPFMEPIYPEFTFKRALPTGVTGDTKGVMFADKEYVRDPALSAFLGKATFRQNIKRSNVDKILREVNSEIQFNETDFENTLQNHLHTVFGEGKRETPSFGLPEGYTPQVLMGERDLAFAETDLNYNVSMVQEYHEKMNKAEQEGNEEEAARFRTLFDEQVKLAKAAALRTGVELKYQQELNPILGIIDLYTDPGGIRSGMEVVFQQKDFKAEDSLESYQAKEKELAQQITDKLNSGMIRNQIDMAVEYRKTDPGVTWVHLDDEGSFGELYSFIGEDDLYTFFERLGPRSKQYMTSSQLVKDMTNEALQGYYLSLSEEEATDAQKFIRSYYQAAIGKEKIKGLLTQAKTEQEHALDINKLERMEEAKAFGGYARNIALMSSPEEMKEAFWADQKLSQLPPQFSPFIKGKIEGDPTLAELINDDRIDFPRLKKEAELIHRYSKQQVFSTNVGGAIQAITTSRTVDLQAGEIAIKPDPSAFIMETALTTLETGLVEFPYSPIPYFLQEMQPLSLGNFVGGTWNEVPELWLNQGAKRKKRGATGYMDSEKNQIDPLDWFFHEQVGQEFLSYVKDKYEKEVEDAGFFDADPNITYEELMEYTDSFIKEKYKDQYLGFKPYLDTQNAFQLYGAELALALTNVLDKVPYMGPNPLIYSYEAYLAENFPEHYRPTRNLDLGYFSRVIPSSSYTLRHAE